MQNQRPYTVYYDGDCGICERSVRVLRGLDWLRRFRYARFQSEEAQGYFGTAGSAAAPEEVVMAATTGTREWRGYQAVRAALLRTPLPWLSFGALLWMQPWVALAVVLALSPLGDPVGVRVYRWVARNRHRFPGSTCSLENR